MSCERYRDALTDAAAGQPASPPLDAHLAACAACRGELDRLRELMAVAEESLAALAVAEPSPVLRVRIREAVTSEPEPTAGPPSRVAWAVAVAAVLAIAVLGLWRTAVVQAPAPALVDRTPAEPSSSPAAGHPRAPAVDPAAEGREPVRPAGRPAPPSRTSLPHAARSDAPAPGVLVLAGEQEALLRFVVLVHRERLAPSALAAVGQPSGDLAGPASIDIRPLEIVPLDAAESPGTD